MITFIRLQEVLEICFQNGPARCLERSELTDLRTGSCALCCMLFGRGDAAVQQIANYAAERNLKRSKRV